MVDVEVSESEQLAVREHLMSPEHFSLQAVSPVPLFSQVSRVSRVYNEG